MFDLGSQSFSFTGHAEYMGAITSETGRRIPGQRPRPASAEMGHGQAPPGAANVLHVGVEYQLWTNKLGNIGDEHALQLLVVWQMD